VAQRQRWRKAVLLIGPLCKRPQVGFQLPFQHLGSHLEQSPYPITCWRSSGRQLLQLFINNLFLQPAISALAQMVAFRTEDGTQDSTHTLLYNKVWLAQWGVSHWGDRVAVKGWEADDCTRGANLFGVATLQQARINGRSGNKDAQ